MDSNMIELTWLSVLRDPQEVLAEQPNLKYSDEEGYGLIEYTTEYARNPMWVEGVPVSTGNDELFSEQTIRLQAGDVLFQYTDGVTEAMHEKQLVVEAGLLTATAGAPSSNPKELLGYIRQQIDGFVGKEPQFDDITMMGLRYNGISAAEDGSDQI